MKIDEKRKEAHRKIAEEMNLPIKLVQKYDVIMTHLQMTLIEIYELKFQRKGMLMIYRQYEIYAEVEDKARIYMVVRVAEKTVLRMWVRNTTDHYLNWVVATIAHCIEAQPKKVLMKASR